MACLTSSILILAIVAHSKAAWLASWTTNFQKPLMWLTGYNSELYVATLPRPWPVIVYSVERHGGPDT